MFLPLLCSLYYNEGDSNAFVYSMAITSCIGALFYFLFKPGNGKISLTHKEGFLIVATGWFLAATFGSLPYMIYGALPQFCNAFFESMSGFTCNREHRKSSPWNTLMAFPDPVAGGHGNYYTVHRHTTAPRSGGNAIIQGGTAQSRERQAYSPCGRDSAYPVDSLYHHLHN